jgi:hypothetical protein
MDSVFRMLASPVQATSIITLPQLAIEWFIVSRRSEREGCRLDVRRTVV